MFRVIRSRMTRALGGLAAAILIAVPGFAAQQGGTITGRVTDAQTGAPLPSVQIYIGSLNLGGLSQQNGRYLLENVPAGAHTLTAERIGYRPGSQEVTVTTGVAEVNFDLAPDALRLNEIVVTGTAGGSQRRAVGNVVAQLDVADLATVSPSVTLQQILGDRLPGLMVMPGMGSPGSDGGAIRIRGSASPGLPNDPIVYIDGIRINSARRYQSRTQATSRLNDIDPADIESIEVIKGPSASTLYGTEAANGVIQIITKRGVAGEPSFDASIEFGASWLPVPHEKVGDRWATNPQTGELITHNIFLAEEARFGKPLFQYGPLRRYAGSVRGGTDRVRYYGSLNRHYREGVVDWNWEEGTSGRVNLGITARDNLQLDLNISVVEGDSQDDGDIWSQVFAGSPINALDAGGLDDRRRGFQSRPPEALEFGRQGFRGVGRRTTSLTLSHTLNWLAQRLTVGLDVTNEKRTQFTPKDLENQWYGRASREGRKSVTIRETRFTTLDYTTTASFRWVDDQLGTATSVGLQYNRNWWQQINSSGADFATEALSTVGAAATTDGSERLLENITVGTYVQQQLDWEERIFVTGAVRFDDNSAFGTDFDAVLYPKLSATWVLHEEAFWNMDRVNQFRIRGAWGQAGIQPEVFASSRLYGTQAGPGDIPIITPQTIGNADLGPEISEELEVGFDAGFFGDRVGLSFTSYWKTTQDAIVSKPTPESLGFPSDQLINIGETKNSGTETELNVRILTADPLRWDVHVAFATLHSEITDLGGVLRVPVGRGRAHVEGFSLASIFLPFVVGAEFESGDRGQTKNNMCDGGTGHRGLEMGGIPVPCDDAPFIHLGDTQPTWHTSVASTFTLFTNWTLYAQVDARGGHNQFHDAMAANHTTYVSTLCSNLQDDPICMAQRQVNRGPLGVYNATFARLRDLSLGYDLPFGLAQRLGMDRASVRLGWRNVALLYFPGQNVGKILGIKDLVRTPDPEMSQSQEFTGEVHRGMPPLSQLTMSVRASF